MDDFRFNCVMLLAAGLVFGQAALADIWRVGDGDQPWRLHPVSFILDTGVSFKSDHVWGGSHAVEVVVDDDGDGLIDEDPVNLVDNDGDLLFNEDPANGIDDDRDGLIDEDGADPQLDDDGDGLINEDGLMTGDLIFNPTIRERYLEVPFFRDPPEYGDDDYDGRFNEDPINGVDDDGDGLLDEDDRAPTLPLPSQWQRPVYAYEPPAGLTSGAGLSFSYDAEGDLYWAVDAAGDTVQALPQRRSLAPTDWVRPIRLNAQRNVLRLVDDRFLSGIFGPVDPIALPRGAVRTGDTGSGQTVDGNIFTAREFVQRGGGLNSALNGLFTIDRVRYSPRPDFPDRTPPSFRLRYAGDHPSDIRRRQSSSGDVNISLVANRFLVPEQINQTRPVVKDFILDPPERVRVINMGSTTSEGTSWELAEAEVYGHGYALDASYVTEIIDVGPVRPRFRRYFDPEDPARPIPFENIRTKDDDRDGSIDPEERAIARLHAQFDTASAGRLVNWGKVRWRGQVEGDNANVLVRVRTGNSLDTHIYQRRVGLGVVSPFSGLPLVLDWPPSGSRIDATAYVALSGIRRNPVQRLPYNTFTDRDGSPGGWSPWSAPFSFADGQVDEFGEGGVPMSLPPLTRYIQLRFDFESTEDSGISLDYVEFDYSSPFVGRGVVAEIFPDTVGQLGQEAAFQYVLKPDFGQGGDPGFNRIDIAVPSINAQMDSMVVDGLPWRRADVQPPAGLDGAELQDWIDGLSLDDGQFVVQAYLDSTNGLPRLGIKTRTLEAADFPRGQGRDIQIFLRTPVFTLLSRFDSWVWNDRAGTDLLQQAAQGGNAADQLPTDGVEVTVAGSETTLELRAVTPNPFTPNGDGINERVEFRFDLFLVTGHTPVEVSLYDLGGQRVRILESGALAGAQILHWDGRDDAGDLVAPGLYLYLISSGTDAESGEITGTIALAY